MPQLPPQVPQTRRSTYRPMKLMNGDFLTQLKRPLCSELGPEIKGTNKGKAAECKHTVGLWYKDQTFSLRKLNKAEDEVYDTFLHVHKEKHKRQKEAYKKKQEEARRLAEVARQKALDNVDLLRHPETLQAKPSQTTSEVKLPALGKGVSVSKVIEVTKAKGLTDTRDCQQKEDIEDEVTTDSLSGIEKDSWTAQIPEKAEDCIVGELNDVNEMICPTHDQSDSIDSRSKKGHKKVSKSLSKGELLTTNTEDNNKTTMKRRSGLSNFLITPQMNESTDNESLGKPLATKTIYRKSFTNIMPVINEDEHGGFEVSMQTATQSQPLTVSYESVFSVPLVSESDISTESSSTTTPRSQPGATKDTRYTSESMVKTNKKKKRDLERRRKMILDAEPFQTYDRADNGEIIPAVIPFKKKAFPPPSNKEKVFQKKMLNAQKDAMASQDQKIEDFYRKLDIDKDKQYFIRQRVPTPIEKYEEMGAVGAGLEQLAQIFKHRNLHIPAGVDPESMEAMQYCQYIRTHDFDAPKKRSTRSQYNVF